MKAWISSPRASPGRDRGRGTVLCLCPEEEEMGEKRGEKQREQEEGGTPSVALRMGWAFRLSPRASCKAVLAELSV